MLLVKKKKKKTILVDAAAHSGHGILIRYDIGAKPVEHSELECTNVGELYLENAHLLMGNWHGAPIN